MSKTKATKSKSALKIQPKLISKNRAQKASQNRAQEASQSRPQNRCAWANTHELFIPYHDLEWGVPVHDDRMLFEMLNLEGAQAGLSWLTVLKKREGYRKAFDNFDAKKIARYTDEKCAKLMQNEGIVRNRLKIRAVVENAKAYLAVQKEFGKAGESGAVGFKPRGAGANGAADKGGFDAYIWSFTGGKIIPYKKRDEAIAISEVMSKELRKRGFKFVGATICFAYMQAVGIVNDHGPECFCYTK